MSRVQCLECGVAVVVDPTGVCPEGHLIGSAGARVARGMGSDAPHPEEPEPWVATVVLDEPYADPVAVPRTIRPVQVAGADAAVQAMGEAADQESMLRELHALGDVHDLAAGSAVPRVAGDPTSGSTAPRADLSDAALGAAPPSDSPGSGARPAAPAATPPQEQVAEGFAELAALEAAFHLMDRYEEINRDDGKAPASDASRAFEEDPARGAAPTAPAARPAPDHPVPASPDTTATTSAAPGPTAPVPPATSPGDDLAGFEDLFASAAAHAPDRALSTSPPGDPAMPSGAADTATPPSARPAGSTIPGGPDAASGPEAANATAPDRSPPATPAPDESDATPTDEIPAVGLDITNFTARGGKVGSGRGGFRKRFGR